MTIPIIITFSYSVKIRFKPSGYTEYLLINTQALRGTLNMLWDMLRESLQETLPKSEYNLWIKPLTCQRQDEQIIELAGPDRFFCSWVRDRYLNLINDKLKGLDTKGTKSVKLSVAAPLQICL